jgi:hypothetical protein
MSRPYGVNLLLDFCILNSAKSFARTAPQDSDFAWPSAKM